MFSSLQTNCPNFLPTGEEVWMGNNIEIVAQATGGDAYNTTNASSLTSQSGGVVYVPEQYVGEDSDGDGIPDLVELYGLKSNGEPINTNPNSKDTDGDGIEDNEELGFIIGDLTSDVPIAEYVRALKPHSDPTKADTDGNGVLDNGDIDPLFYDESNELLYQSQHKIGIGYIDGEIADDLKINDYSSDEMMNISNKFKYQLDSSEEYLYDDFKGLMSMFAITEEGRDIVSELINTFINGTENYINIPTNDGVVLMPCYTSEKLKEKIYYDEQVQEYMSAVVGEFSAQIQQHNGNLIKAKRAMQNIIEDSGTSHIAFSRDSVGYLFGGMTLSINDLWGSSVDISTFEVNGNSYNGVLHFQLYDHFGLDQPDVEKIYVNLAGFRAWFVLQHYDDFNGKYKPFINVFDYYIPFSGTLS